MKRFDCLAQETKVLGPHLLEASAGTGKTFTIEHVFVRLILEKVPIEKILVVTFTRAATRELKYRIRANLEKALQSLLNNQAAWPYLEPFIGSDDATISLSQSCLCFDEAKIFTIHGFCYRMLKELAFEAGKLLPMSDPDDDSEIARKIRFSLAEFWLSKVDHTLLCPEQIAILFGKFDTLQELGLAIAQARKEKEERSFVNWHQAFQEALKNAPETSIKDEFVAIFLNYKAHIGDFEEQIHWLTKALEKPDDPMPFRKLIQHQGTLFSFLDPKNKKVRAKEIPSPFFNWANATIAPIVFDAANRKNILRVLTYAWKLWEKESVGILHPDEIVEEMKLALDEPLFLQSLKERFQAVIIDEFQDTDAIQWEIFQKAFLECPTLFLVGDPKQSIYRFRNADVYTYFLAKETLGIENVYHLDTNFRSSKELLGCLNALFSRNWLHLPQNNTSIEYIPVLAGSAITSALRDEKKAVHWMIGDENASFLNAFLPYTVAEIEKLQLTEYKSVAILVKDRYELEQALDLLRSRGIPCIARSQQRLSETFEFGAIRELFVAIANPENESARWIAEQGPFQTQRSFSYWRSVLEEEGLARFYSEFFRQSSPDVKQIMEELFAWEQREGFSFVGMQRFFDGFEMVRRRSDEVEDAVQILTLHVSKGLEFEIVFAMALASPSVDQDEEINAEKQRQQYVAMTRAKKRLYVPYKKAQTKRFSAMDIFVAQIEAEVGEFIPYLGKLSENYDLSFEQIPAPFILPLKTLQPQKIKDSYSAPKIGYQPCTIQSFTSLAKTETLKIETTEDVLPRGKETGTIIHEVFEALFQNGGWKKDTDKLVENALKFTSLSNAIPTVQNLIRQTLELSISDGNQTFCLKEISEVFPEMEFIYKRESDYITGSMDLVFIFEEKVYLVDWKTNVLNHKQADVVMKANDYRLQATLYKEALQRHFGNEKQIGGVFYIFIRTGDYVFIE
ncbi:MAG TPA: UvrD-helicase domain-containing protein [Chlamydiales bacterium]|nr:UvrD-helicase domain-containing protein [Chlamydiales bacterium]